MANVRPRVRTASDWDELEFLVQSAGVPIEQAIGIEATTSQGKPTNGPLVSVRTSRQSYSLWMPEYSRLFLFDSAYS